MPDPVDLVEDDAAESATEPPVFVDTTGRRRKIFRRVAIGGGVLTVGYVAVLVAALLGAPVPSPLLVPITQLGPGHTDVATTPADPPDRSATSEAPPTPESSADTTPGEAGGAPERSVAATAVQPPATTTKTAPGVDHRSTHAPDTPPGKDDTSKKPRP
ncbi:hypothetical protein [Amycolatopsis sp. FDAARGOS 1241]|uniref:hypothetical protein n=1 Tax=Amycolatopsis sp. FDAARGOS 1241 TaxID=2778070 RepID=UPI00195143A9|nr:hypothetical protein [Amycolatopsis sp. FDAARGOS 1241]QRP44321.1 hypothetical protein I6J71_34355 [Amycolatopsis sp. FDAARGOS 1241]